MIIAGLSPILHSGLTLIDVFLGASSLVVVFRAIKSDPKDRVLLFETLAFITLFLGLFVLKAIGVSWLASVVWLTLFFGFVLTALCFGILNWRRRRKHVS